MTMIYWVGTYFTVQSTMASGKNDYFVLKSLIMIHITMIKDG